jgi:hypothetical protein
MSSLIAAPIQAGPAASGQAASGQADPAPRCFQNISLRATYTVRLSTTGEQVQGVFVVAPDSGDKKEYPFAGTRHAQRLSVRFAGEQVPEILTRKRPLVWTVVPPTGKDESGESLRITIYGQNYETKKFSNYDIKLTPCPAQASAAPAAPPATNATK